MNAYQPGAVSLIQRAERLPSLHADHKDPLRLDGPAYAAQLALQTETSLRNSSAAWCPDRCRQVPCHCPDGQALPDELRWHMPRSWGSGTGARAGLDPQAGRKRTCSQGERS